MEVFPHAAPTFRWSPADERRSSALGGQADAPSVELGAELGAEGLLRDTLETLVDQRGLAADEVARRVAAASHRWLVESAPVLGSAEGASSAEGSTKRLGATDGDLWQALERELTPTWAVHAWRAPVAGLRLGLAAAARVPGTAQREALLEECALWCEDRCSEEGDGTWDGSPLGRGPRLPDRARVAAPFLEGPDALERGEVVIVHGWSETVARTLEAAQRRGLAPEAIVSEGGADLGGRKLARRLAQAGVPVRFIFDAALPDAVRCADRVWLGTDAIGARAFVGRVGTRMLLQEARRAELSCAVLATSDKLMPGGELHLPAWCEDEPWLLWERPPAGVTIQSQAFEAVPLEHVDLFATEFGLESAAELSLRALRFA